jgi:hypothetical protein
MPPYRIFFWRSTLGVIIVIDDPCNRAVAGHPRGRRYLLAQPRLVRWLIFFVYPNRCRVYEVRTHLFNYSRDYACSLMHRSSPTSATSTMMGSPSECSLEDADTLFDFLQPQEKISTTSSSTMDVEDDGIVCGGGELAGGELKTPRELSHRASVRKNLVVGHDRRIVRARQHPHVPARRTKDEKKTYKLWLLDKYLLVDTGSMNDCGCALHPHGCYNGLITALFAHKKVEKLLLHRRIRFEAKFCDLAPVKLLEMHKALGPALPSPTQVFFDYKVSRSLEFLV